MPPTDYQNIFKTLLDAKEDPVTFEALYDEFISIRKVGKGTVKKHLKNFIKNNPEYLDKLLGFYPDVDSIISMAEEEFGEGIAGHNLFEINGICKGIVDRLTKPLHEDFLKTLLDNKIDRDGKVQVDFNELLELIYENYGDFINERGNSLVSIAGSMNEMILIRGLVNSGLTEGSDFIKTGHQSEADLNLIYRPPAGNIKTLYAEIKSYHARERFLRGLRDIPHPEKIGIGFFISSKEFNPSRTDLYVKTGTWAIYMPDNTYRDIDERSKEFTSVTQSRMYRPLTMFCDDMKTYCSTGSLSDY
jgi:CTP-dependent riboflavin kinase